MATVPIVTEVTKAQLDALVAANGLNDGLQYKVTDKNWLLIATGTNTLEAIFGKIVINYPDTMPDYIDAQFLILKSGAIPNNVETFDFTAFKTGYMFMYCDFEFISDTTMSAFVTAGGVQLTDSASGSVDSQLRVYIHTENPDFIAPKSGDFSISITDNNTGGMKAAIVLSKFNS